SPRRRQMRPMGRICQNFVGGDFHQPLRGALAEPQGLDERQPVAVLHLVLGLLQVSASGNDAFGCAAEVIGDDPAPVVSSALRADGDLRVGGCDVISGSDQTAKLIDIQGLDRGRDRGGARSIYGHALATRSRALMRCSIHSWISSARQTLRDALNLTGLGNLPLVQRRQRWGLAYRIPASPKVRVVQ